MKCQRIDKVSMIPPGHHEHTHLKQIVIYLVDVDIFHWITQKTELLVVSGILVWKTSLYKMLWLFVQDLSDI